MNTLFAKLWANKHTSGAGLFYLLLNVAIPILQAWIPGHDQQFNTTRRVLEGAAVGYGLIMAGDAKKPDNTNDGPSHPYPPR